MKFESYKVNPQHRGILPLKQKSRWSIDEWEELRLFILANANSWKCSKTGTLWSIYSNNQSPKKIGYDSNDDLIVAKYVCDQQNQWHGYPVSTKQFDIPPSAVLDSWVSTGLVRKSVADKMLRGKL